MSEGEEKAISLWVYRLTVMVLCLLALWFGWSVRHAAGLQPVDQTKFDKTVMFIAGYPDMAVDAVQQVMELASGDYLDKEIRIPRGPAVIDDSFVPIAADDRIGLDGLLVRAEPARMRPGWRFVAGAFHLEGGPENAILLISPDNVVVHRWHLNEPRTEDYEPKPPYRTLPHGVEILPDGSIIYVLDGGASLQRFDKCSNRLWIEQAVFHHAVHLDPENDAVWSLVGTQGFTRNALDSGRLERHFTADDMIAANPDSNLLELRRLFMKPEDENPRNVAGSWLADPFHFNDIEPLPAAIADRFPMAEAGDVMISARSLNLVFIVDPETLKIKWWRIGTAQRQHDPDWQPDGRITMFDNRMNRDYSQIVALDPVTFEREILFDGRKNDFFTRIRGKHQLLDDGTLVIASPQQGRAFEVDPEGEIVFELVNTKPGSDEYNYTISELRWLPLDFFDVKDWSCPATDR